MKILTLNAFALLPILAFSQPSGFSLKGNVQKADAPAKAYLIYRSGSTNLVDSTQVKKGIFEFKGSVTNPVKAMLVLDHNGIGFANLRKQKIADVLPLYLENGDIVLSAIDSIAKAKFSGSKINEDNLRYQALVKPVTNKLIDLKKEFDAATQDQQRSPAFREGFQKRADLIENEQKAISKKFITQNPASFISLELLTSLGGYYPEYNEVYPLFSALAREVRESAAGKAYLETLERVRSTAIGAIAPEFTQNDPDGKPVKLSDFKGKYVLLDFWAAWCGPCRQENPNVVANYNKYKSKNFTVLGVSLDRPGDKEKWVKAIEDDKLTWTNVSELNYFQNAAAIKYGIVAIPQNYLIDPDGKIIAKNLRGEELGKKLEEVLKEN